MVLTFIRFLTAGVFRIAFLYDGGLPQLGNGVQYSHVELGHYDGLLNDAHDVGSEFIDDE